VELDLVKDEQTIYSELGIKKDSHLKYVSKADLQNASLSPVSKRRRDVIRVSLTHRKADHVSTVANG
jgi:hypothetical protein